MNTQITAVLSRRSKKIRHSLINFLIKKIAPKLFEDIQYGKYDLSYNFEIPQLIFLCDCVERTRDVEGAIAEIGACEGRTTVFLNKYMDQRKIEKKYYAIDTFSGFTKEDIEYESLNRNKDVSLFTGFKTSKKTFDTIMSRNYVARVMSIQADVNRYDLTSLGNLCFALLDVDLYRPMKKSLRELYPVLSPNGIIVVDDCDEKSEAWDGSDQAYKEFMGEINQPIEIILGKLGIVRKLS